MTSPLELDETVTRALADVQTVTATGRSIAQVIDGVKLHSPVNHVDHRGRVYEIYPGDNEYWTDPVVYCYGWSVRALTTKGWGLHYEKTDRYTLIHGEVMVVLFDARVNSPTHGIVQKVSVSTESWRQVTIPAGVWHLTVNLGESEAFLINHPTTVYRHEKPDRLLLPWNTSAIPIDIRELFPIQLKSDGECH